MSRSGIYVMNGVYVTEWSLCYGVAFMLQSGVCVTEGNLCVMEGNLMLHSGTDVMEWN